TTSTGEVTSYQWDYRNRLTQVTTRNASGTVIMLANYTYDVFDRRIARVVDADGAGPGAPTTERFVYDGANIALTLHSAGGLTHRTLYGPKSDQVLAEENGSGVVLWALADNLGSVRDVIDSSGAVQDHIRYDGYGRIIAESNALADFEFAYA